MENEGKKEIEKIKKSFIEGKKNLDINAGNLVSHIGDDVIDLIYERAGGISLYR